MMPFREKAKNLFKTKSRGDSLSKTSTNESSIDRDRYPSNVYKPGEPMPRPKYRAPPTKEHKDHLEAFSFADAWRRKSFHSIYSPGGTRASSRRPSMLSQGRKSVGGRSVGEKSEGGRTNSITSEDTEKSGVQQKERRGTAMIMKLETEPEHEGNDDVANVGLSRVQSKDRRPRTADDPKMNAEPNGLHKTMSTAHDHQPFTEQDLAIALQRSHLQVPDLTVSAQS